MSFLLPHAIVAEPVKDLGVGYARVFMLVGLDGHERVRAFGDTGSVGEGALFEESSLEADWCHEMDQCDLIDFERYIGEGTHVDWVDGLSVTL